MAKPTAGVLPNANGQTDTKAHGKRQSLRHTPELMAKPTAGVLPNANGQRPVSRVQIIRKRQDAEQALMCFAPAVQHKNIFARSLSKNDEGRAFFVPEKQK